MSPEPRTDGIRTERPEPTARARLWFGWVGVWGSLLLLLGGPLLVLHSALRPTARTFRAWLLPWSRAVLALAGVRVRVERRASLPDGPVVFAVNHVNAFDVPTTAVAFDRPFVYMARHEVRAWPLVGWVLDRTACLFLRRDNPRQAVADLRRAAETIRGGASVVLFPEGGRSYVHALQPFMRGPFVLAVEAGVPLVPVALVGNSGVFSSQRRTARPGHVRVVLGEPISTRDLRRSDAAALRDRVEAWVEAELSKAGPVARIPSSG